ncbi:MAG: hypothetical protein MUF27_15535 [Acidobacteria bacterium]|nr:hypothetical protein [Acidobacteriota bacterium]
MSAQPRVLATAIFFLGAANACLAADLTQWAWRNPLPQGNPLYAAACSPARCVAVGEGALLTSTDGESWSAQPLPDGLQYAGGVIYAAGQFVAAGGSGYGIATSTDGLDWTARAPGVELNAVAYGNGTFVAVGPMGAVLTSSDGASWIPASSGSTQNLAAVAFGNGRFVATNAAAAGKGSVLVSTDGVHWTPAEAGTAYNQAVTFGAGRFVVAGSGTSVATSTDGSIWTEAPLGAYANLLGIAARAASSRSATRVRSTPRPTRRRGVPAPPRPARRCRGSSGPRGASSRSAGAAGSTPRPTGCSSRRGSAGPVSS